MPVTSQCCHPEVSFPRYAQEGFGHHSKMANAGLMPSISGLSWPEPPVPRRFARDEVFSGFPAPITTSTPRPCSRNGKAAMFTQADADDASQLVP